jgi:hypothetical protein
MTLNITGDTFTCVDVATGSELYYDKLMLGDKEVLDTYCSSMAGVVLAVNPGEIVRDGGSVTFNNARSYTEHAVLKYKLDNRVLTILGLAE